MSIPEGATHKAVGPRIDCWYKNINCLGFEFMNQGGNKWIKRDGLPNWPYERISQTKPWSGPQDGLPPVGSIVEVFECTHDYTKRFNGQKVRILCHENDVAVFSAKNFEYHALVKDKFRPIRTKEQLIQEQRETSIREFMDIVGIDCRVTASKAVDAGFKREVG